MIKVVRNWLNKHSREVAEAKKQSTDAREAVYDKLKRAREAGTTAQLSRVALQRITHVDQHN